MANLSKIRRDKMIQFLETLKKQHSDDESLIAINQIEKELVSKRYGLVWEEHEENVDVMMRENIPVFTEVTEREIAEASEEGYNFLLEGDNLHSLYLLEKTHKGKGDVIYIDPPYNTGSKDFIYDDVFVDNNDGFKHSKWLSFMAERLTIAERLLSERGVLVISIGYQEVHNLMILCQSIFGNKQIVCITVQTSGGKPNGGFTYVQEYLVFITTEEFQPHAMSFIGGIERSPYEGLTLSTFDKTTRPNQVYPIFIDKGTMQIIGVGDSLTERINNSTGWDCPRAKILVKLREGGSEDFQIQTIGRIRRMPEKKHYGLNILDFCYLYTLDTKYKEGMLSSMDKAYQLRRLFLKDEVKGFSLTKELRNLDYDGLGERETLLRVHDYFKKTYLLSGNKETNKVNLEGAGYNFAEEIDSRVLRGIFRTTEELAKQDAHRQIVMKTQINTHTHGIYLLHAIDEIKKVTGMQSQKVKTILERMFRKGKNTKYKFLSLDTNAFYAFIINNTAKLKMDFKQVTSQMNVQQSFVLKPKTDRFVIPEQEMYKYSEVKREQLFRLYAYWKYTTAFCTERTRSLPERLFERYCENNDGVKWFYKNGDAGQQYLSIVYIDGLQKQWLFYPDYIVQKENGETWLIETKGGEAAGHSKNIDMQMGNKFLAFKRYAEEYGLKWGFVRDIDEQLYINNTEFVDDMSDERWVAIEEEFG